MITSSYDRTHVKQHPAQLYVLADKEKYKKRVYQNIGEASQSHSQTVIV